MRPVITLITDFGHSEFPGICRAVIKRLCPEAEIVDISHAVPPFDVRAGALVLRDAAPYLPVGIHVVIVDPGVGTARRALALRTRRGDVLVGPDSGVLLPGAKRLGGVQAAVAIQNPDALLHPTSATFHGRDVFCPAAARLAAGLPFEALGPAVDPAGLVRPDLPEPVLGEGVLRGQILTFDSFGSARTNIPSDLVARLGVRPGDPVEVDLDGRPLRAPFVTTYADVPPGEVCLLIDSAWDLAIAVNRGSARERLGLRAGQPVTLRRAGDRRAQEPGGVPS